MKNILMKLKRLFCLCAVRRSALHLTKDEEIAVINALWRRGDDFSTEHIKGDEHIRYTCKRIAKEMMS